MQFVYRSAFIVGLLISALSADCSDLLASQKIQPLMETTDMGRAMSANESLLERFQKEKEELLRSKAQDQESHLLKNKLKILDAKISFLQSELKRTQPAKTVKKAVERPAVQASTPLSVLWRPQAALEPRRRIFVAEAQKKAELQPVTVSMQSSAPSERATPKQELVTVRLLPQAKLAERDQPMASAVPKKAELPVSTKIKAPAASVVKPSVPRQKTAKTGRDWKMMSAADKDIYVLSVMGNLGRRDIFLEKGHSFYIREINNRLQRDPSLEEEYVHKILIASAYENEPESRQDIDKIGQ